MLHGTADGSSAGSNLEHLNLSISTSSTSFSSRQRLEKLVLGEGSVSPTFVLIFLFILFYLILFYFDLFNFIFIFSLILS